MAISAPVSLASGNDIANQSTPYSFSMTPTNGRLVRINVLTQKSAPTAPLPTLSGGGLTYTPIADVLINSDAYRIASWWTVRPSGSGAITVSVDIGGVAHIGCAWSVYEYAGADTTSPIVQVQTAVSNTLESAASVALATFASTSAGDCVIGLSHNRVITERTNWTEIHDVAATTPDGRVESQYRLGDVGSDDASGTWSLTARWGIIAMELAVASTGAYTLAADASSVAISAPAVGVLATRLLTANAASVALTGTAATLTYAPSGGYVLSAQSASVAITAMDVDVRRGRLLTAGSAAITLTGTAAGLTYANRRLIASSAAYLLTASEVNLQGPGEIGFSEIDVGRLAATGSTQRLRAEAPEVVLTGAPGELLL